MTNPILVKVSQLASEVLNVPVQQIVTRRAVEGTSVLDSLQLLNLVLELEQSFQVHFSPEDMDEMTDIPAIAQMVERKLSAR